MKTCPYCGISNREGLLFCVECGRQLVGKSATEAVSMTKTFKPETDQFTVHATWGTARFEGNSQIVMHIRDYTEPVNITPDMRTIMGRYDTSSTQRPDLDLTPFGALEKGVSRVHAAITRNDDTDTLNIVDLGSANGTHLNGQRLIPEQPRVLRDGDEIRLGKLVAHIYFKS